MSSHTSPTAVAMSGGVDSSVAAGLIHARGSAMLGFSMKLIDPIDGERERYGRCCSPEDFRDARAVADQLGFPHYVLDMQEEFRRSVLEPFADDYKTGRTPSPCIRCNTFMKFGRLLSRARAVGADRVATGHYAILEPDPKSGRTLLRQARDRDKDQSYFLFDLSESQRKRAEFPLGAMSKDEVRERAREMGLATAEKSESMDLCFVDEGESYRDYLARTGLVTDEPTGEIVDTRGESLGRHEGLSAFTVGQRRGLGISSDRKLYVVEVNAGRNQVVVGEERELARERCRVSRTRFIPFERLDGTLACDVRINSNHPGAAAKVTPLEDGQAEVCFDTPQRAITPGQAAVFYDGDLVLGGGWIQ